MLLGSQVSGEYFVEEMALERPRGSVGAERSVLMRQLQGPGSFLAESGRANGIQPLPLSPLESPNATILGSRSLHLGDDRMTQ